MTRHILCTVAELPEGRSRTFELNEDTSVVVARTGERVFALEDRCSHDDGAFDDGPVEIDGDRAEIECPRHGGRFDLTNGRATRMPAIAPIECFTAGVADGSVWIDVPEY